MDTRHSAGEAAEEKDRVIAREKRMAELRAKYPAGSQRVENLNSEGSVGETIMYAGTAILLIIGVCVGAVYLLVHYMDEYDALHKA